MTKITKLRDVVDWRLCIGCGACAYICPEEKVELWDFLNEGIRPVVKETDCASCRLCLDVCPAVHTNFTLPPEDSERVVSDPALAAPEYRHDWGEVLEVWEGHATDPEIRFKGSSGGVLTALAAFCLEQKGMHGVLHIGQDPDDPVRNWTRLSRSREELISATGSRYSPASVCDHLEWVEDAPAPCVVIGKPSEIAALRRAEALKPQLARNVGLTLSFFCAESPSTAGTVALLEGMGLSPSGIKDLRYRGYGWPGHFAPIRHGETEPFQKIPYRDSWRRLQSFRPWSVHMWPDGTGELADISCGDPWYEQPDGENPGFSLLVVRTNRGRQLLQRAIEAGYLKVSRAEAWKLVKSQGYLARKKASTWGRLLSLRCFGAPTPQFKNAHLFRCWLRLSFGEKVRSVAGTIRRIVQRKLYRPLKLDHSTAIRVRTRSARQPSVTANL
ncbi:MAG TPA: Coenzyme F420 hydrogenase/dehydrogenase, beta subunit C-terminal domain [Verrucomicrobiae bacterium]|nr:Coenzyme F420 hydrogenase/dehydrogenase, beta subunit C-terminal domain [Verrucomicrobiae bacterium]